MSPSEASACPAEQGLSFGDTEELRKKLGPLAGSIVLVGGQALNYWVDYFRPRELSGQTFTSKDVDFFGSASDAARASEILDGSVAYPPSEDVRTPNSALVTYVDASGARRELDFLRRVAGLDATEIEMTAVPIGTSLRVLHPYLCLKSRAANVIELGRHDARSVGQLRAAVLCVREYLAQLFAEMPREFFRAVEILASYARRDSNALGVFFRHDVDVLAVPDVPHDVFRTRRLPLLREQVRRERERQTPRP